MQARFEHDAIKLRSFAIPKECLRRRVGDGDKVLGQEQSAK